jgi:hypothetical protein
MLASGGLFAFLNLHRVAFATSALWWAGFGGPAGMLVSWLGLAVATVVLCQILPPTENLSVADSQDRVLLVFFVLCGAIGTRLIAPKQRA